MFYDIITGPWRCLRIYSLFNCDIINFLHWILDLLRPYVLKCHSFEHLTLRLCRLSLLSLICWPLTWAESVPTCPMCDETTEVLLMGSPPGPTFAHGVKCGACPLVFFWHLFRNVTFGLPWWLGGKESTCQCGRHEFYLWSGKIPHSAGQLSPCVTTTEPAL